MPPGEVKAARVTGKVTMTVNGVVSDVTTGSLIPQTAKVNTQNGASAVLAFSNGATTQLGPDTELVIEEFLVDPFASEIKIADLTDEPTSSHTKLALNRGELVGNVKHLNKTKGSTFSVQTPVGAAGIRGTTFRIVFRPNGTGQAFFQLSTVEGNVGFTQPDANGAPAAGGTTTVTGTGTAGVAVPQGQEVSITVDVSTNAQGQLVVTVLPPPVTTTSNVSVATMQAVTQVAQEIAVAVQQTVFTPPAPAPNPPANNPPAETNNTPPPTETTTTTTTVSGPNFTADLEVTTSPPPVQPQRIVTNGGGTSGG